MEWAEVIPWLLAGVASLAAIFAYLRKQTRADPREDEQARRRVSHHAEDEARRRTVLLEKHHRRTEAIEAALDLDDPNERARALLDAWRRAAGGP